MRGEPSLTPPEVRHDYNCELCGQEMSGDEKLFWTSTAWACPMCFLKTVLQSDIFIPSHEDSVAEQIADALEIEYREASKMEDDYWNE